ncbi:MAG: FAD-dependent oxidoreductase [Planctomycetota bacterium]
MPQPPRLLMARDPRAAELAQVPYAAVVVISFGLRREQVRHPLDGFGFLVPRGEGLRILGCLFPSSLFDGRAPAGCVTLTCFLGGATDPEAMALDDAALRRLALGDIDRALGLRGEPLVHRLSAGRARHPSVRGGPRPLCRSSRSSWSAITWICASAATTCTACRWVIASAPRAARPQPAAMSQRRRWRGPDECSMPRPHVACARASFARGSASGIFMSLLRSPVNVARGC